MHACFVFWIVLDSLVSRSLLGRFFVPILQSIATSNFFLALNGFLVLSIFRVDEMPLSLVLSIELWLFGPFLLLLLRCFRHVGPNFRPQILTSGGCKKLWKPPLPDHIDPFEGCLFKNVNFVNPVQDSDKLRFASTFQESSMRLSCNTSRFVCAVLVTSMYFSGIGNVSSFSTLS